MTYICAIKENTRFLQQKYLNIQEGTSQENTQGSKLLSKHFFVTLNEQKLARLSNNYFPVLMKRR